MRRTEEERREREEKKREREKRRREAVNHVVCWERGKENYTAWMTVIKRKKILKEREQK